MNTDIDPLMDKLQNLLVSVVDNKQNDVETIDTLIKVVGKFAELLPSLCDRVGTGGGVKFILECMPTWLSWGLVSHDYQYHDILVTLDKLLSSSANVELFFDLDGGRNLYFTTFLLQKNRDIQLLGFKIINKVVHKNRPSCKLLVEEEYISLVMQQFKFHASDLEVMQTAFVSMNNIVFNARSVKLFKLLDGLAQFLKVMREYKYDKNIQQNGFEVMIQLLRNNVDCCYEKSNFLIVIMKAMCDNITDEHIMELGMDILWHVHETKKLQLTNQKVTTDY
jgi:hypothetical protein